MLPIAELRRAVRDGLAYVSAQPDVEQAEVFASANGNLTVRLNYTSNIPSNGVEEPKSLESRGVCVRVAFRTGEGLKTGFGSEPNDLSIEGIAAALNKARIGAVLDPDFVSLPAPLPPELASVSQLEAVGAQPAEPGVHGARRYDPAIMRLGNNRLVQAGWRMVDRGLETFQSSEELADLAADSGGLTKLGLILGGDVVFLQERMAIASTLMPRVQSDESTKVMSFATAMVESMAAKGSGWSVGARLSAFDGAAAAEAARNAISAIDGVRMPGGKYRVVLGPQAFAEILEWVLLPGLYLDTFYAGASPFMGKLGQQVASPELTIQDCGAQPSLETSKLITDEGMPAGTANLIHNGVLSGLMSDYYNYRRMLHDPNGKAKLGAEPGSVAAAFAPLNGFRPGNGGGRSFESPPSITPTNLLTLGQTRHSRDDLLRLVGDGIYIGRIWYTYPVNGITAGDFSGTIVGDSYVIRDGKLSAPLRANTLRMNDNVLRVINNILGIGSHRRPTVRWSSDQVTWAPEIAVAGFELEEIAGRA